MLHYVLIENSEGIDNSEGQDVVRSTNLLSKQCISCHFFYFITRNFKYEKNVCDGCFHCIIYENENKNLIFRVATVKKGNYRTVSSYFLKEVRDILEKANIARKFGWLYIEDLTSIEHNNETKNWNKRTKISAE